MKEYLEKYYPHVLREYERSLKYKFDDLKVGTQLLMLKPGFGGNAGVVRIVLEAPETEGDRAVRFFKETMEGKNPNRHSARRAILREGTPTDTSWRYTYSLEEISPHGEPWYQVCFIIDPNDPPDYRGAAGKEWFQRNIGMQLY